MCTWTAPRHTAPLGFAMGSPASITPSTYDPATNTPQDTVERKARFLQNYNKYGIIGKACSVTGISRTAYEYWMRSDEEFAIAARAARENATDMLELEAVRRATIGVKQPVYHNGELIDYVRKKSDGLLTFLLKANREKFRDRVELSGPDGQTLAPVANVQINVVSGRETSELGPLPMESTPAKPATARLELETED